MCQSSGYLELQLISVENDRGELANGNCCDGARSAQNGLCDQDECDTFLRVCLKEYQVEVTTSGLCTYGSGSSSVIGGNTFQSKGFNGNPNKANDLGTVIIPFQFAWPVGVHRYPLSSALQQQTNKPFLWAFSLSLSLYRLHCEKMSARFYEFELEFS